MKRFGHLARLFAVVGVAVVAACGEAGEAAQSGAGGGGGGRGGGGPTFVETGTAELGTVSRGVTVSGVVEPIRTVGVNSQLAGALLSVDAQEGDEVRQGEVLARIDQRELEAQRASAEAAFQVAQAAFQRAEQLRDRQVITLPEYERERTAYAAAQAQLEQLRTRIGYATVVSPLTGVVTEQAVEEGDVVGNQTRLFSVADISTLVVPVGVSELDVVRLEVGQQAEVTLDAFPGRGFEGRIRRIFPTADPVTRLVTVEVALEPEANRTVKPGFLARVRFALAERDDVLLVPGSAIVGVGGMQAVFVVQGSRVVQRLVTTGLTSEGRVEILSGLDAGDVVVIAGNNTLRDGAEVRVVGSVASPDDAADMTTARDSLP